MNALVDFSVSEVAVSMHPRRMWLIDTTCNIDDSSNVLWRAYGATSFDARRAPCI
jgi:hypothetical protein